MKNKPPKKAGICDACGGELYQRPDDNEETIKTRMDVYLKNLKPMLDYYRAQNKLTTLNGDDDTRKVHDGLVRMFDENRKSHKH